MMLEDSQIFVDLRPTLILFYKFLKHCGLFHSLYKSDARHVPKLNSPVPKYGYGGHCLKDLWLDWGGYIITGDDCLSTQKRLQYSQLWRFFILDNLRSLEFKNDEAKRYFIHNLKNSITNNGTRNSPLVRKCFESHGMTIDEKLDKKLNMFLL
jgi:hypothetical protein